MFYAASVNTYYLDVVVLKGNSVVFVPFTSASTSTTPLLLTNSSYNSMLSEVKAAVAAGLNYTAALNMSS
jgi:hypothetical protein